MNSKRIGNIGEAKVLSKFVEFGIPVYIPFGDNERADLVAEFGGKLNKIQVKTAITSKGGAIEFHLTSSTEHRANGTKRKYSREDIDYFALYSLERDTVYLMRAPKEPLATVSIRFEPSKNGQQRGVNEEGEYLFGKVLSALV